MKSQVTMRDIAEKLGVSIVTISKALNDKEGVSRELKFKIKTMAEEMGYRFNSTARAMKEGYSHNIGVIVPERFAGDEKSFYLKFYHQIARILEEYNYYGILQVLKFEDESNLALPRIYEESKVDAIIVLGQVSRDYVDVFNRLDIPKVFLDFYTNSSKIDSIISDNFYGAYELTNYLVKNGHRDIAFVGNIHSTSSIQDRYLGYYKSLLEHNIPLRDYFLLNDRDEFGKFVDIELPDRLPTAFVCNCDLVGYHLMNKLQKMGYHIPDDFSIVGFDNDIYSTLTNPQMTTVAVDVLEMCRFAVKSVIEKIHDPSTNYGRVFVKGNIIYRDSVKTLSSAE